MHANDSIGGAARHLLRTFWKKNGRAGRERQSKTVTASGGRPTGKSLGRYHYHKTPKDLRTGEDENERF